MIPFIAPILTWISSAIATVGPVVARVATTLVTKLPQLAQTIYVVAKTIVEIAEKLGLNDIEDPEQIGAKMTQEGTRARMEDESMEDYIRYLKNEVELDRERLLHMSEQEKIECNAVGIGAIAESLQEKTGVELSGDFIVNSYNIKMTAEEISKFIESFEKNGLDNMDILSRFLEGKLDSVHLDKVLTVVENTEKELYPKASEAEILMKIEELKEALQNAPK